MTSTVSDCIVEVKLFAYETPLSKVLDSLRDFIDGRMSLEDFRVVCLPFMATSHGDPLDTILNLIDSEIVDWCHALLIDEATCKQHLWLIGAAAELWLSDRSRSKRRFLPVTEQPVYLLTEPLPPSHPDEPRTP